MRGQPPNVFPRTASGRDRQREADTDAVVCVVMKLKSGETRTRVVAVRIVAVVHTPGVLVLTLVVIYSHHAIFTDRLSTARNAIAHVRPSVCPSVSTLTFEPSDR